MAKYEIEVDSQDEFYDEMNTNSIENIVVAETSQQVRSVVKRKGRGFSAEEPQAQVLSGIKHFDTIREEVSGRALRSVEGWVIFVSNLNEEVTEDEVLEKFSDFGRVRDVRLNLDHRTGYVKGYALVEFEEYQQAVQAIEELDGKSWLGNKLSLDFCFVKPRNN